MAGLMGGRVAEEEIFGEPSTGASNDLQQATGLARMMVRDYGMSGLGPVALSESSGPSFLGHQGPEPRAYSDRTALEIDREVQALVLQAQSRARDVVRRHRDKLDMLAARLLTAEVVEEEEMVRLWGPKVERPGRIREPRPHRGAARASRAGPSRPPRARRPPSLRRRRWRGRTTPSRTGGWRTEPYPPRSQGALPARDPAGLVDRAGDSSARCRRQPLDRSERGCLLQPERVRGEDPRRGRAVVAITDGASTAVLAGRLLSWLGRRGARCLGLTRAPYG